MYGTDSCGLATRFRLLIKTVFLIILSVKQKKLQEKTREEEKEER